MRKRELCITLLPAAIVILVAVCAWWKLRSDAQSDNSRLHQLRAGSTSPSPSSKNLTALDQRVPENVRDLVTTDLAALQAEYESIEAEIKRQTTALGNVRDATAELRSQSPLASDEITSSLGSLSEMGKEMAVVTRACAFTNGHSPSLDLTDEERTELFGSLIKVMSWAPQIGELESRPAEIATFQSAALSEFYNHDVEAGTEIEEIVARHFTTMNEAGLIATARPESDPASSESEGAVKEWDDRRSAALGRLMVDLRPHLGEGDPELTKAFLPNLLNMGIGAITIESETEYGSNIGWALPAWPVPLWLDQ